MKRLLIALAVATGLSALGITLWCVIGEMSFTEFYAIPNRLAVFGSFIASVGALYYPYKRGEPLQTKVEMERQLRKYKLED